MAAMISGLKDVDLAIVDILCKDKAKSAHIYANPADMGGYEFWEKYKYPGADEAIQDCWYYQLGYWIIEDIFQTIEAMNSASNSILTSPVKRLLRTSFTLIGKGDSKRRRPTKRIPTRRSVSPGNMPRRGPCSESISRTGSTTTNRRARFRCRTRWPVLRRRIWSSCWECAWGRGQ